MFTSQITTQASFLNFSSPSASCLESTHNKSFTIDHSTTQRKLHPFLGVWQATQKDDAAECKSTLDLLPEDLSLSCFGEGKLTQRSKRQGYRFLLLCDAVFLVSFLPCQTPPPDHVQCDGMKACQTISGLVRKTRGRLIIPWHMIG